MKYTIIYKEAENKYEMNGVLADFIRDHLKVIAYNHEIYGTFYSETELLFYLRDAGIEIDLLEENGSRMVW